MTKQQGDKLNSWTRFLNALSSFSSKLIWGIIGIIIIATIGRFLYLKWQEPTTKRIKRPTETPIQKIIPWKDIDKEIVSALRTASEAAEKNVIDLLAESPEDLMRQIGEQGITLEGKTVTFGPEKYSITAFEPSLRYHIFSWLLHPQIAYLLLLGGIAGLFFELSNPGAVFPGVFGGVCLVLGLYAMAVLPVTVAGLLLIFLSILLFVLELAVTSYGLLTIAGVVSLFFGSILLFNFEYGLGSLPLGTILPTVAVVCACIIFALYLVTRAQLKPRTTGAEAMKGLTGRVTRWEQDRGQIMVRGELWRARSASGAALAPDTTVRVVDIQGLYLLVEPVSPETEE